MLITPMIGSAVSEYELVILGVLPGSSKYFFDLELRANPARFASNREVYWGKVRYEKKLLWLVPISHTITDRAKDTPSGDLPYDIYSGGFFDILDLLTTGDPNGIDLIDRLPANSLVNERYGFIPVVSALEIRNTNGNDPTPFDYLKSYSGGMPSDPNLQSGFNAFIVDNQPFNNEHISFQVRNGNWLAAELEANIPGNTLPELPNCSFVCDENSIIGSGLVCNTATYSINSPEITNIDWTITPANAGTITVNMFDVTQMTITRAFGYNGSVTLNASVDTNRCGNNIPLNKTIHFGRPTANGSVQVTGDSDLNPGPTDAAVFTVNTSNVRAWDSIDWVIFSNSYPNASINFNIQSTGGSGKTVVVTAESYTPEGNYTIQSRLTNSCGFYPVNKTFYVNEAGDPQFYPRLSSSYSVYPNPSKDIVNIDFIQDQDFKEQTKEIKVSGELFDVLGRSKLKIDMQNNGAQINVSRLNPGVYVLKIYLGANIETHQVLVK
jgi:hypothetical protein